ncbi:MAG: hypothetical protein HC883_01035 [Bdellovibrionaceae bacterium]|nr:hypothetical protein [Pseudobdellovibrionaceae bacterium]
MNKSWIVHLMNVFVGSQVIATETAIDVIVNGAHHLAMRKDGSGHFYDASEELGLPGLFSLAPIPKEARIYKLKRDGTIGLDELAEERKAIRDVFRCKKHGHVLSCDELEKQGFKFEKANHVWGKCTLVPETKKPETPEEL